jgi:hypothetical protein
MTVYPISYVAVLVAGIASMALGFLWYSPVLFGKPWMALMGITPEKIAEAKAKGGMPKTYVLMFIFALIGAYVLAHTMEVFPTQTVSQIAYVVFFLWLGFMVPIYLGSYLWESRPLKLFWINSLYGLVSLLISGVIIRFLS